MQYSPSLNIMLPLAAQEAVAGRFPKIEPEHLLLALLKFADVDLQEIASAAGDVQLPELIVVEQQNLQTLLAKRGLVPTLFRRRLRAALGKGSGVARGDVMHRSAEAKRVFAAAETLAQKKGQVTGGVRPVLCTDFLEVLLDQPSTLVASLLQKESPETSPAVVIGAERGPVVEEPLQPQPTPMQLGKLAGTLKALRDELRAKIFGQDHAIQAFVEGLFSAEVVAEADESRQRPKGIFVFAGPPGVGKTYLAESGATALGRPFKRFDMTAYSDHEAGMLLIGTNRSFRGAHPGQLTGFVAEHANAVLLFDEIEKAHLNTLQLFMQVLDAGRLEDKFTEETVKFRDTVIIFTTNAGKSIYDRQNATGVNTANTGYHRKTILDALEKETDPRTGKSIFPPALCSRLATGYPIMFNHLGVNELERIACKEMERQGELLAQQYGKLVEFDSTVPLCLVLREGSNTDARTVKSQVEIFVKSEMYKFCQLYRPERLQQVLDNTQRIVFRVDAQTEASAEVKSLLEQEEKPKLLLVADKQLANLWSEHLPGIAWKDAQDATTAANILSIEEIDLVLLDLWVESESVLLTVMGLHETVYQFDFVPAAARGIAEGQAILQKLHEQYPDVPCYLLSLVHNGGGVDEELFLTCVRSGGARGLLETSFLSKEAEGWETARDNLATILESTSRQVWREGKARQLGAEHKALSFDTAPRTSDEDRIIEIRLRNLRLARALAAEDVSEVLDEVDRPSITFSDVYGADAAKGELQYIVEWLQDPRKYRSMGLHPPRGILLYGDPGTGKTMLARALAGESKVAFLVASAANFITIWQGSGPQNVRDLFNRARRYAPAIVFIDEIDAIGKKRTGGVGGQAEATEQTLNALLTEMDGFSTPAMRPVVVIAATNLVEHLDDALRRRFDRDIEVDKPDRAARVAYLKRRLQGTPVRQVTSPVIQRMAGQTAGMTIAELERIVELAGRMAAGGDGVINDELAEEAFERMRMGEARGRPDAETLLRVARHEAGHCLVGWLRGEKPVQITIMARGKAGGFVEREADEERMLYTKGELEGMIRQSMGGRAAEMLYYGDDEGLSTGVGEDLRAATHYAEMMVRHYGMDAKVGQVVLDAARFDGGTVAAEIMRAAEHIVKTQLDHAHSELEKSRAVLDRLVDALIEKNRLTRDELEEILPRV